jgi:hypothetical protein
MTTRAEPDRAVARKSISARRSGPLGVCIRSHESACRHTKEFSYYPSAVDLDVAEIAGEKMSRQ